MKEFTLGLALKQRRKATWKLPIVGSLVSTMYVVLKEYN